jgi:hypothetical protein
MAGSLYQACTKFADMAAPEEDSFATVVALQPSYLTRTNGTTIETEDTIEVGAQAWLRVHANA